MNEIDFNKLFNDSYEYIQNHSDEFYDCFYQHFIESSPKIGEKFTGVNLENQKLMLQQAISHTIGFFVTKTASPYILNIAKQHQNLGVSDEMYELFMTSLIFTLEKQYPHYTAECGLAWRIFMSPALELMKHINDV
ncbi:hypothetical protein LNTAR_02102 [Lentisphaera araneosa HTCC2155]|jgi:hemoglobin-like flavoprotein|uniref:Globin domain-containing protein n=2 Tax=Lentisphaera TaxID=256846 RepID=A6DP30_9BACT|nr:hypothetical protein LNTAR_02102 [Lentisphaera araneosa HTCC2155]